MTVVIIAYILYRVASPPKMRLVRKALEELFSATRNRGIGGVLCASTVSC